MLRLLFLLTLLTFSVFAQVEEKKELTLEEKVEEEAKIREEVLKKYRVKPEESESEILDSSDQEEKIQDTQALPQDLKEKINSESLMDLFKSGEGQEVKSSFLSNMIPASMKDMLSKMLKTNPFSKLSKEDVKSMLISQSEGKPLGKAFKENPNLLDFCVDWIRDPKAMPALMGMVNKPDEMKNYGLAVLVVFILSFILNFLNKSGGFFKRVLKKLMITFSALIINLLLFYWFFQNELSPTLKIAKKYFFS